MILFRFFFSCRRFVVVNHFELAVAGHAGAGGDEFADDDVFLEAQERIFLAFDSGFGKYSGGFLEGCGGEEGVGGQGCLGGAEEQVFTDGFLSAFVFEAFIGAAVCDDIYGFAGEPAGVSGIYDLDLAEHLVNDDFNVFIIDFYALASIYFLYFFNDIVLGSLYAEDCQDIVGVDVTFEEAGACFDVLSVLYGNLFGHRNLFAFRFLIVGDVDDLNVGVWAAG